MMVFDIHMKKKPLENTVGKGENAGNQHFSSIFYPFVPFEPQFKLLSANGFNLDKTKMLSSGKM